MSSFMAKIRIIIRPCQNVGIDTPIRPKTLQILSRTEYCLVAEMTPKLTPTITMNVVLSAVSKSVVGKRCMISFRTGCLV